MSIEAIRATLYKQVGSPPQKAILLILANWADQDNKCWPSIKKLAIVTQLGERTVQRALADLEADGHIEKQFRCDAKGAHTSSVYRLTYVPDPLEDGVAAAGYGVSVAGRGVTAAPRGGVTAAPNTKSSSTHQNTTKEDTPSGSGELPFALPPMGERVASPEPAKVTAEALIETWNRHCSHVKKLTRPSAGTKQVILGRFKSEFESDLAQWERFCKRAANAPWLAGVNPTGWRLPNIEWLLRPAKLDALWANSYGGEAPRQQAPSKAPYAGYNPHLRPGDPGWRPSPGTI